MSDPDQKVVERPQYWISRLQTTLVQAFQRTQNFLLERLLLLLGFRAIRDLKWGLTSKNAAGEPAWSGCLPPTMVVILERPRHLQIFVLDYWTDI